MNIQVCLDLRRLEIQLPVSVSASPVESQRWLSIYVSFVHIWQGFCTIVRQQVYTSRNYFLALMQRSQILYRSHAKASEFLNASSLSLRKSWSKINTKVSQNLIIISLLNFKRKNAFDLRNNFLRWYFYTCDCTPTFNFQFF